MWIITFYLMRTILLSTFVVLLIFLSVNIVFSFIGELTALKTSYTAADAFMYSLLKTPLRIVQLFPLAIMIGAIFALGRLSDQNELTIIRAAGVSVGKLALIIMLAGSLPLIIMIGITELIAPESEASARVLHNKKKGNQLFNHTRYGAWVRHGDNFFHIKNMYSSFDMGDVSLFSFGDSNKLQLAAIAKHARLDQNGNWLFKDFTQTHFGTDKLTVDHKKNHKMISGLSANVLQKLQVEPDYLSMIDLWSQRSYLKDNKLNSHAVDTAILKKIAYPLTTFLMLLLAFPFVLGSSREQSISQRIFIGIMAGFSFSMISMITENMGALYNIAPVINVFAPLLVFLFIAFLLYRRI